MSERKADRSLNIFDLIDQICGDFRSSWKAGKRPRIEVILKRVPEESRSHLFHRLLTIELGFRQRAGDEPFSDEYRKRFPEYGRVIGDAFFESAALSIDGQDLELEDSDDLTSTEYTSTARDLGDYVLIRELGRGAFGIVYEAKHKTRGNRVALKTLPSGSSGEDVSPDRLHRFRHEFRSLSEINHPNLVGMQTLEVDEGKWFFTMDLVEGIDFLSYVRPDDCLNVDRLRPSIAQLVKGTIELHDRGIIHRDLKPSNVLVDSDGRVVILDFGLVAQLQRAGDATMSRSGMFAGTPRYAAPEQMFGERNEASDWYAVGSMIYEALTGSVPFSGKQRDLLRQKQELEPTPLNENQSYPPDLVVLVNGLLKRDPGHRHSTDDIVKILHLDSDTFGRGTANSSRSSSEHEEFDLPLPTDGEQVLIGRDSQLAQLRVAKQDFVANDQPMVVWISGKSGEGKSVLAESFLKPLDLDPKALVLRGRCYDRESVPFKGIDGVIPSLISYLRRRPEAEVVTDLPEDVALLARLFPVLRRIDAIATRSTTELGPIESEEATKRALRALKDWLRALSRRFLLVIFIDDLQWADAESASAVFHILTDDDPPSILFLGSYRCDEADASPFLHVWRDMIIQRGSRIRESTVAVQALSREQCADFVQWRTGIDRALLSDQLDHLLRDSGGNPYLLDLLLENFDSEVHEPRHTSLEEVIEARLERLPNEAKKLLETIAVSGQPMTMEEASRASSLSDSASATLTRMRNERLIRIVGGSEGNCVDTFHDKVREKVLEWLTTEEREKIHQRLAESIEQEQAVTAAEWRSNIFSESTPGKYRHNTHSRIADLAHHYSAANDPRAFPYLVLAAEQAYLAFAAVDANRWYRMVREAMPENVSASCRYRVVVASGHVYRWLRDVEQARAAFTEAAELAVTNLDKALAYGGRANTARQIGRYDQSLRDDELALECLGFRLAKTRIGKLISGTMSLILLTLVPAHWLRRRTEKQRRNCERVFQVKELDTQDVAEAGFSKLWESQLFMSLTGIRSGQTDFMAIGYMNAGQVVSAIGITSWARILVKRASRLGASPKYFDTKVMLDGSEGLACYWMGDLARAGELIAAAASLSLKIQRLVITQASLHMQRHVHAYLGTASQELELAQSVLDLSSEIGNPQGVCWGEYDVACAYARRGDLSSAVDHMSRSYRALEHGRFRMTEPIRDSSAAFVLLQSSCYRRSRDRAIVALKLSRDEWMMIDVAMFCLPLLIEATACANWLSAASATTRRELKWSLRKALFYQRLLPNHQPHVLRVCGRANWRLGRQRKATHQFMKAIRYSDRKAMAYQKARSLLDLAAVKEEGRDENRAEAIQLLKKMESVIPRAESWLLGDQYDEEVIAPEFDLAAWEAKHGPISSPREEEE